MERILLCIHVNHGTEVHHLEELLYRISTFHDVVSRTSFTKLMDDASCTRILLLFHEHIDTIRTDIPLTAFWMSYHDVTQIMLGLLRATREGDWLLHLASIRAMIPWRFAYDKVNYARYLSHYYATMSRLPIYHTEVRQQ